MGITEKQSNQSKALEMVKSNKAVSERAENYVTAAKRNIQRDVIDVIVSKIETMEDELFELTNFDLETDMNQGRVQMTKDAVEARFKKIIDNEFKLKLVRLELTSKEESFSKYFGNAE